MFKKLTLLTIALLAFAGNSVLCRLALGEQAIDASSFTILRLFSGALFLWLLVALKEKHYVTLSLKQWRSSMSLFVYAITFSLAYLLLDTGTGALILFGFVQLTIIAFTFIQGKKLQIIEWIGLSIAFSGLLILLLPGASAPSLNGFILMAASGIAWAIYTILGKGSHSPLRDTATNFMSTLPLVALLLIISLYQANLSSQGIILAITSGIVTSGMGYAIWYAVLTHISVTQAAISQLLVPIIASVAGVIFTNEAMTMQLLIASIFILGGILTLTLGKKTDHDSCSK